MANVQFGAPVAVEREVVLVKPVKSYVLIAGLDYHDIWSFNSYSLKEKKRIDGLANSTEIQIIYIVDILPGTILKIEKDEGVITETTTDYDAITSANYTNYVFGDLGKSNYITKNVIYDLIGSIGAQYPDSIMEVHIFSHAYFNGPILANSYESGGVDMDMRMNEVSGQSGKFSVGLNPSGYVKVWGCNFPTASNALYSKLRRNSKYTESAIADTEVFSYPRNHFHFVIGAETLDLVGTINSYLGTSYTRDQKIDLTFKQIKYIASKDFVSSYSAFLAYYADINVYSALPATYADINPAFKISSQTKENVDFFTSHLNISVDSGNYGLYTRANVTLLNAATP